MKKQRGITLIALIITVIVMLILAGVVLNLAIGERGIFNTAKESKTEHIIAEMREELELALNELQLEKQGNATLDDVTQEWADNNKLKEYGTIIEDDALANQKTATMTKDGITVRFVIDEKLNIIEAEQITGNEQYQTITMNLGEGISIDNKRTKTAYDKPYSATVSGEGEYIVETLTVTMGGEPVTVDVGTGKIDIEKVTGDIVITATSKKLELQITGPIIGTSASATESVADNSIVKGTPLYINLSATLEGTSCTIVYKEDNTKTVPYEITDDGTYTFIITGEYNGKTITKEVEVKTNKYKVYKISTPEDLQNINKDLEGYYIVVNDIDMTGFNFQPIWGNFRGSLDGQGYTISGLTITNPINNFSGMFLRMSNATIENIIFKDINISGGQYSALFTLSSDNDGAKNTFSKVGITGQISASECGASFQGTNWGKSVKFENCYSRVNYIGTGKFYGFTWGEVPNGSISITNSYYAGTISTNATKYPFIHNYGDWQSLSNIFYNKTLVTPQTDKFSGTGLTTSEFADKNNFTDWNFENDWYIDLETGYPELKF